MQVQAQLGVAHQRDKERQDRIKSQQSLPVEVIKSTPYEVQLERDIIKEEMERVTSRLVKIVNRPTCRGNHVGA